jgi:hypothetical protein
MMDGYTIFAAVCFFFAAFLLGVGVGAAKTRREFNDHLRRLERKYR